MNIRQKLSLLAASLLAGLFGIGYLVQKEEVPTSPESALVAVTEGANGVHALSPDKSDVRAEYVLPHSLETSEAKTLAFEQAQRLAREFAPGEFPSAQHVIDLLSVAVLDLRDLGKAQPKMWSATALGGDGQAAGSTPWEVGSEYSLELRFPLENQSPGGLAASLVLSIDGVSDPRPPGFLRGWIETSPSPGVTLPGKEITSAYISIDLEDGWIRYGDISSSGSSDHWTQSNRWRSHQSERFSPDLSSVPLELIEDLARARAQSQ